MSFTIVKRVFLIGAFLSAGCSSSPSFEAGRGSTLAPAADVNTLKTSLPRNMSASLLYIAREQPSGVDIYDFPKSKTLEGQIVIEATGICSNSVGDVWISTPNGIEKYTHGETTPVAKLNIQHASGCAVDPATGNLAVAVDVPPSENGGVAVFRKAKGKPKVYSVSDMSDYDFCSYDTAGNLLVQGSSSSDVQYAELGKGGKKLKYLNLALTASGRPAGVQWDGQYFVAGYTGSATLYQLSVTGDQAILAGEVGVAIRKGFTTLQFWIQGNVLVVNATDGPSFQVASYPYPKGKPERHHHVLSARPVGVTVSGKSS
jgi:hypothetical protein